MKKNSLKIFTLLVAGLFLTNISIEKVYAAPLETITVDIIEGTESCLATGVLNTSNMKVNINGKIYQAYCAWYEKKPPVPTAGLSGGQAYKKMDLPDDIAAGLAAIINDSDHQKIYYPGTDGTTMIALKTAAINLFLTEKTGVNRFNNIEFINGIFYHTKDNIQSMLDAFKAQHSAFSSGDLATMCNKDYNGHTYGDEAVATEASCKNQAVVYSLYNLGVTTANNVTSAYLKFSDSSDKKLTYKDGNYVGTFVVESNLKLQSDSLKYTVTGVSDASKVVATKSVHENTGTVTISIPESVINNIDEVNVEVEASITNKKSVIYQLNNEDLRNEYQDLLFAQYEEEPIVVSTNAKPIKVPIIKTCYRYVVECNNTACEKTNTNNIRTCQSRVEPYPAANCDSADTGNKASGKYTYELIKGVCSLYCTEKATAFYPGNVRPAITLGTNFAWPTAKDDIYPLTTKAKMTCNIEMNDDSAVTQACINAANNSNLANNYQNGSGTKLIYDDTTGDVEIALKQSCEASSRIDGTTVTIDNDCSYTLPENNNVAVNKETVEFVNENAEISANAVTNYVLISKYNGVLPVGGYKWADNTTFSNVHFNKDYKLQISDLALGNESQFTSVLNAVPYVCNYRVTKSISGQCNCPPGTVHSGEELSDYMKDQPQTCAEAIQKYCNIPTPIRNTCTKTDGTEVDITSCLLTNDRKTCEKINECAVTCTKRDGTEVDITTCVKEYNLAKCKEDYECTKKLLCPPNSYYPEKSYQSCMNGGKSEQECIQQVCYCTKNCEYNCPKGTDYEGMDITNCVEEEKAKGATLQQALNTCEKTCNQGGNIIIYRTISLENPFPSMNSDQTVTQLNLKVGMFNDSIKGRYPGSNWNSVSVVKDKILNNRGYDGSAIYQEATPLYTIELDAKAIQEIRKYNKEQLNNDEGYADFTLSCTDGAYCRSKFLRDERFKTATGSPILSGGTCQFVDSKKSFISCYTYKK